MRVDKGEPAVRGLGRRRRRGGPSRSDSSPGPLGLGSFGVSHIFRGRNGGLQNSIGDEYLFWVEVLQM